ncbi:spore coat protein GerQ [Bacillus alkalicellulosilyticus]|uniref:spore coat protein GerQ n=1 Tax=Alkalihalobacterium alkalicellulosilyticum TaxID=1912214 RepID=UPI00099632FF|nr:spore coat protein GerQ [Bacillus alkalicellulosilyticus]
MYQQQPGQQAPSSAQQPEQQFAQQEQFAQQFAQPFPQQQMPFPPPQFQAPVPPPFYAPQPQFQPQFPSVPGMLPMEMSYIENILRLNRGKVVTVYMTFENNVEWNARIFTGIIEEAGRDHIILQDTQSEKHYLLLMVYLDYIEFLEHPEYDYPFGAVQQGVLSQYPPR